MKSRTRMQAITSSVLLILVLASSSTFVFAADPDKVSWQAGFDKVVITPDEPIWMDGYGGRSKPAEGKIHDLYAKAAALRDPSGKLVVFVSTDLIGVPIKMTRLIAAQMKQRHGLEREDIMITCSHTHCGPALDHDLSHMLDMKASDWDKVYKYQDQLNHKIIGIMEGAIKALQPSRLKTGVGNCGFASNRRTPKGLGPYDHEVPVLRVTSVDGSELRGVIFGYACHNTTLSFYQWCGDYAGFAQIHLEDRHPGAVALFFAGCGADQNPLPRRKVELAQKYGRMLGVAVDKVLDSKMQSVEGSAGSAFKEIDLAFDRLPSQKELEAELKNGNRYTRARATLLLHKLKENGKLDATYPYPVQVWRLGNAVTWVTLGGEVVVDYSVRLKKELGQGRTWVTGYANDVMSYIPSERVLQEGGYEGDSSMIVYQKPSKWKAGLEDQIVGTVHALNKQIAKPR